MTRIATTELTEEVARCLAVIDGVFIDAATWQNEQRGLYHSRARRVLQTIENVQSGNRTGGLPPAVAANNLRIPVTREKTVSTHFTKAQADTACSKCLVEAPTAARVKYIVKPTGKKLKRWMVVSV